MGQNDMKARIELKTWVVTEGRKNMMERQEQKQKEGLYKNRTDEKG